MKTEQNLSVNNTETQIKNIPDNKSQSELPKASQPNSIEQNFFTKPNIYTNTNKTVFQNLNTLINNQTAINTNEDFLINTFSQSLTPRPKSPHTQNTSQIQRSNQKNFHKFNAFYKLILSEYVSDKRFTKPSSPSASEIKNSTQYISSLCVTLGRGHQISISKHMHNQSFWNFSDDVNTCQHVTLKSEKGVSRLHAKIVQNPELESFVFQCLSKNGAYLNGQFISSVSVNQKPHKLKSRSLIQIGHHLIYFLLPPHNLSLISKSQMTLENSSQKNFENESTSFQNNHQNFLENENYLDINLRNSVNEKDPFATLSPQLLFTETNTFNEKVKTLKEKDKDDLNEKTSYKIMKMPLSVCITMFRKSVKQLDCVERETGVLSKQTKKERDRFRNVLLMFGCPRQDKFQEEFGKTRSLREIQHYLLMFIVHLAHICQRNSETDCFPGLIAILRYLSAKIALPSPEIDSTIFNWQVLLNNYKKQAIKICQLFELNIAIKHYGKKAILKNCNVMGRSPSSQQSKKEDRHLLIGVFKHGLGRFDRIRSDTNLIFFRHKFVDRRSSGNVNEKDSKVNVHKTTDDSVKSSPKLKKNETAPLIETASIEKAQNKILKIDTKAHKLVQPTVIMLYGRFKRIIEALIVRRKRRITRRLKRKILLNSSSNQLPHKKSTSTDSNTIETTKSLDEEQRKQENERNEDSSNGVLPVNSLSIDEKKFEDVDDKNLTSNKCEQSSVEVQAFNRTIMACGKPESQEIVLETRSELRNKTAEQLSERFDQLKQVMEELTVSKNIHNINKRPRRWNKFGLSLIGARNLKKRLEMFEYLRLKILSDDEKSQQILKSADSAFELPSQFNSIEYDRALIRGCLKYGFDQQTKIHGDIDLPFKKHPLESLDQQDSALIFQNRAKYLLTLFSNDSESMNFVEDGKVDCCTNFKCDYGEECVDLKMRDKNDENTSKPTLKPPSPDKIVTGSNSLSNKFKRNLKNKVHVNYDAEDKIMYPIEINPSLTILSLGFVDWQRSTFHNNRHIFTIGYKSCREHPSMLDPSKRCKYFNEILDGGKQPIFRVTCELLPDKPIDAASPSAAQLVIDKAIDNLRTKKRKTVSVSGTERFGLAELTVSELIQSLEGADKCSKYFANKNLRKRLKYTQSNKILSSDTINNNKPFNKINTNIALQTNSTNVFDLNSTINRFISQNTGNMRQQSSLNRSNVFTPSLPFQTSLHQTMMGDIPPRPSIPFSRSGALNSGSNSNSSAALSSNLNIN